MPNNHKMWQIAIKYTKWKYSYQKVIKYTRSFYSNVFQTKPKLALLVCKYRYHLATLVRGVRAMN
jgi:hypothetical protein